MAVDPGKSGAIALFDECSNDISVFPFKAMTEVEIAEAVRAALERSKDAQGNPSITAMVERVGGHVAGSDQPGSAMFTFGRNTGFVLGCLAALRIPTVEVVPQKWQAFAGAGTKGGRTKTEWKRHLLGLAQNQYPGKKLTVGVADAVLILAYARSR